CITPSVKLNFKKIYPQVTVERSYSAGFAFWAYWLDTTNNDFSCAANQLEVITDTLDGGSVEESNLIAFSLTIQ
ncbi:MAG TPA: hypothetical protein VG274_04985, partial [Rhizomicrobium sp.]|nr:hypothetical protein [Rhizomicrobium sp.]